MQLPETTVFHAASNSPIDIERDNLVAKAMDEGATDILFLDDDVVHSNPLSLRLLLEAPYDVYSGVYPAKKPRMNPRPPCVLKRFEDGSVTYPGWANRGKMEVDRVGLGFMKIKRKVFEDVPRPWFHWGANRFGDNNNMSDDYFFCDKIRAHGFKIIVDIDLRCRHLAQGSIDENGELQLLIDS